MWSYLVFFVLALLYVNFTRSFKYWSQRNVKFEEPFPLFGNFLNTVLQREGIGNIIKRAYDKFQDVPYFGMFFFRTPFLVIRDREMMRKVLISDFSNFPNRQTYADEFIDQWSTNTLLALKNEEWKSLRSKLSQIFTSGKMKLMMSIMQQVTDQLTDYLEKQNGAEVEVREISKKYFIEIICACVFGIRPNNLNDEHSHIRNMASKLLNIETYKWIFSLIIYFLCPIVVKICSLQFIDESAAQYLVDIFQQSYQKRRETNNTTNDLIDLLLNLKQQEKEDDIFKFDDVRLSAQALLFFQAGQEPASGILSFCLYEMALNSNVQKKLREEILESSKSGKLSYKTLMSMPYLDMVLKETLRKYPLVQVLLRIAEKDYTFEETGFTIENGTNVVVPTLAVHYDPQYYPNPGKFDPERFRGSKSKELQYVYFPFGEGPRKCIGYRFAVMSMKLALAMWVKDFEISISESTENPLIMNKSSFLLSPASNKIYLRIKQIETLKREDL